MGKRRIQCLKIQSEYGAQLFKEVHQQYLGLQFNPSNRPEFMTKRMNMPETDTQSVVAPWDDIMATNRPIPPLENNECIGGLDYASLKDFAAVGLLFRWVMIIFGKLIHSLEKNSLINTN